MRLDGNVYIHVCKDKTLSFRFKGDKSPIQSALPVFTVNTTTEAEELLQLVGRKQYNEHPNLPGRPWFKITLDGELDFKPFLDLEDLDAVSTKLENTYKVMKEHVK